jgi:hypothetical protein
VLHAKFVFVGVIALTSHPAAAFATLDHSTSDPGHEPQAGMAAMLLFMLVLIHQVTLRHQVMLASSSSRPSVDQTRGHKRAR